MIWDQIRLKPGTKLGCLGTSWGPSQGAQGLDQDQARDEARVTRDQIRTKLGTKLGYSGTGSGPTHGFSQGDRGPDQDQAKDQAGVFRDWIRTKPWSLQPRVQPGVGKQQRRCPFPATHPTPAGPPPRAMLGGHLSHGQGLRWGGSGWAWGAGELQGEAAAWQQGPAEDPRCSWGDRQREL